MGTKEGNQWGRGCAWVGEDGCTFVPLVYAFVVILLKLILIELIGVTLVTKL